MKDLEFRALIVLAENDVIYNREAVTKYGEFSSDPNTPHIKALAEELENRGIFLPNLMEKIDFVRRAGWNIQIHANTGRDFKFVIWKGQGDGVESYRGNGATMEQAFDEAQLNLAVPRIMAEISAPVNPQDSEAITK